MPLIDLQVGQPVYIIEVFKIYEANITKFLDQKRVEVTTDHLRQPGYKTIKIYGVNWFLTREKAEQVLAEKTDMWKMKMLEREKEQKKQERRLATQEDILDKLPDSKLKKYITKRLTFDIYDPLDQFDPLDKLEDKIDDKELMEVTCFSCEFGERLNFSQQLNTGKQMFCRKHGTPIMKNEHKNCPYFQPLTLVPITIYSGGTCSGK